MNAPFRATSPWPQRLARATAWCAVPLVLFGSSVTSLEAGMAVQGWIFPEGHFLWFFPLEKWLRDLPTFVEHTHRLFGSAVGLLALATLAASLRARVGRGRVAWALAGVLAVSAQGALGGLRVLQNSPGLAFLHGVCAQLVFGLLCAVAWKLGPASRDTRRLQLERGPALSRTAAIGCALILGQIALGAWYRHGLRAEGAAALDLRLSLHIVGALAVFAAVLILAGRLEGAGEKVGSASRSLATAARRLRVLLLVQLGLGLLSWLSHDPRGLTPLEWLAGVLHVMTGAALLAQAGMTWLMASGHGASGDERGIELAHGSSAGWEGMR